MRGKFFPGTGFCVELVAWFLVLWASVNPRPTCLVCGFVETSEMSLQVPWDTWQVLSLSTFAALEQVFLFKGATGMSILPTHKGRSEVPLV